MVKINSENAAHASELSETSHSLAEKGATEMKNLNAAVEALTESSTKIEEIITAIDDIAFQTNLLALNASVEAARAGEQGKGFAVVADAVRSLAQKSAESAAQISNLIKDNVDKTRLGANTARESSQTLLAILSNIEKVSSINKEIANAGREQSAAIAQISSAMNQLEQTTQHNSSAADSVTSTSQQLMGQASSLNELVDNLRVMIKGK